MFSYSDRTLAFSPYRPRVHTALLVKVLAFPIQVPGFRKARRVVSKDAFFDSMPRPGTALGAAQTIKHGHAFTIVLLWNNHQLLYSGIFK